jgi:formylglycine-generating enzyme required for sulfatase activity
VAWYAANSNVRTHPVVTKNANELGIYDMSGNVEEWCYDWYALYTSAVVTDPSGPTSGSYRVLRGGGWFYNVTSCRCACRGIYMPSNKIPILGLRLALK